MVIQYIKSEQEKEAVKKTAAPSSKDSTSTAKK
jgi:hypothetical protein